MNILREFIYLDETSVYSLMASKLGPIKAEVTESTGIARTRSIDGKIGGDLAVLKSEISSRIEDARTSSTQVVRRSNVQATFKELRDLESGRLLLRSSQEESLSDAYDLDKLLHERIALRIGDLRRGSLIELDLHLRVEDVYEIKSIFDSMSSLGDVSADLFGEGARHLGEVATLNAILERLLVGLVPLRGESVDHVLGEVDGCTFLVEKAYSRYVGGFQNERPLVVVGVADEALFWKDLRRVLFSGLTFRVFARVVTGGVTASWSPVKMLDVMSRVTPQLRDQMNVFSAVAVSAMASAAATHRPSEDRAAEFAIALLAYSSQVCSELGVELDLADVVRVQIAARTGATLFGSARGRRDAFAQVDEIVLARAEDVPDDWPEKALALRSAATPVNEPLPPSSFWNLDSQSDEERLPAVLEVEMVAIYW